MHKSEEENADLKSKIETLQMIIDQKDKTIEELKTQKSDYMK